MKKHVDRMKQPYTRSRLYNILNDYSRHDIQEIMDMKINGRSSMSSKSQLIALTLDWYDNLSSEDRLKWSIRIRQRIRAL